MATAGGNTPAPTLLRTIESNTALQTALNNARQRIGIQAPAAVLTGEVETTEFDAELLQGLVLTNLNGGVDLQEQRVNVEYLRVSDRLLIPVPLNLHVARTPMTSHGTYTILIQRYCRVAATPYATLKDMANGMLAYNEIRTRIDAIAATPVTGIPDRFGIGSTYEVAEGQIDGEDVACIVFGTISRALGFNCDLRDTGILMAIGMTAGDSDWDVEVLPGIERLRSKLHAYTLQCIVALNLAPLGNSHLGAWVRAHGVSAGILPHRSSLCVKEYDFVMTMPRKETLMAIHTWESQQQYDVRTLAMNLLALFGLLHLAKDHTYKSNDPEMTRICTSYLMTLRTIVPSETMDSMKQNMEVLCRTAAHPFGLAQTYLVARIMAYHARLAKPLQIRIAATPPPVQRLMIVQAATNEWKNVHVGKELNELHAAELLTISEEIGKIMKKPPYYSGLSRLYGHPIPSTIPDDAKVAADVMMPLIYGYAMSQHCDEQQKKDGIALALSLGNVSRDHGVLAQRFITMWDNYMDKMEEEGLLRSAREARKNMLVPVTAAGGV